MWAMHMIQHLKLPVLYWGDRYWPQECLDECTAFMLLNSDTPCRAISLGTGNFPNAVVEDEQADIIIYNGGVMVNDAGREVYLTDSTCGPPYLVDWEKGEVAWVTMR